MLLTTQRSKKHVSFQISFVFKNDKRARVVLINLQSAVEQICQVLICFKGSQHLLKLEQASNTSWARHSHHPIHCTAFTELT